MEKFKKYMDILDKVLNALRIAALVMSIVMAVFAVVGFIGIPGVVIGEVETQLELGGVQIQLADSVLKDAKTLNMNLAVSALLVAMQSVIAFLMLKAMQKFVAPMKDGDIFHADVAHNIKNLAIYVLIGGFLTEVISFAGAYLLMSAYDINSIFNTEAVISHSVDFEMDGDFVIYAGIIYLLSYVFKYGSELQSQVDETL